MSELRVALIVEGPTDAIIIEAALKAILDRPFVLQMLQPEATRPTAGTGWCGVFKWCRAFAERGAAGLENDPTLPGFDLFVVHIDADIAEKSYTDGGPEVEVAARTFSTLPCVRPCPPPSAAVDEARTRLVEWLGLKQVGPRTVVSVPSKAIEAWLAVGVLQNGHALLKGLECNLQLENHLGALSLTQRIRKGQREYRQRESAVLSGRVEGRRGGVQGGPWLYPPFPASCPFRLVHRSFSGPRHIEPDRRISRIRLTAKASSIEVMFPCGWRALSRPRIRRGSRQIAPTVRIRWRYSTASNQIPSAAASSPQIASP